MKELFALLKQSFELSAKMRWLKTIDKENDKYKKLIEKSNRQLYIVNELLKEYHKKYGENLRNIKKGGE